jgi:hypothetical protein
MPNPYLYQLLTIIAVWLTRVSLRQGCTLWLLFNRNVAVHTYLLLAGSNDNKIREGSGSLSRRGV